MAQDGPLPQSPVPIERLAADLRRLYVRLGGQRTDTTSATWSRQSPEEWEANLAEFDRVLVATCHALRVPVPAPGAPGSVAAADRALLIDALARAGVDLRGVT